MKLWKAYVECILGVEVQDAQVKFDALPEAERNAWAAVVVAASAK